MGCSITILLEVVDFTGRMKRPVGGLIETRNRGVGLRGGTAYSFPRFLGSLQPFGVLFLLGCAILGSGCQQRCWPSYGALNVGGGCLCLGRLVAAASGFQLTGRPAGSEC